MLRKSGRTISGIKKTEETRSAGLATIKRVLLIENANII